MAAKDVKFNSDARDRMLRGVNILADDRGKKNLNQLRF